MVNTSPELGLGPLQFVREAFRSLGITAHYLGRHALASVRVRYVLLLAAMVVSVLLLVES
jgi:hypothetical protein